MKTLGLIAVVGVLLAVRLLVLVPFRIPTASMQPTLRPGDHVLVDRLQDPRRGDLAVFRQPGSGQTDLKRIVAVAGDTVAIEDGALYVDGRRRHEAYAKAKAIDSVYFGPVRVRAGTVFALGDNRADSLDSRAFGAVPRSRIVGRVLARIWPPARWGLPG